MNVDICDNQSIKLGLSLVLLPQIFKSALFTIVSIAHCSKPETNSILAIVDTIIDCQYLDKVNHAQASFGTIGERFKK